MTTASYKRGSISANPGLGSVIQLVFDSIPRLQFSSFYSKKEIIYDILESFQLRQAQILATHFGKSVACPLCVEKSYLDPSNFSYSGS